ncbi:hypothetical protein TK90_2798 (plasmid) [Thioalkalivibrio sp. K90mix]|uniref:hypothetical protein n=1 Tax=Thioalkalivibrio sp. (strain K90mix) TaxID=396595 RepID=UPI000195A71C|nr:hypothetical protein [Thioalkalivibrio sp. K90mix]ADC73283.1 hypothetical protein TK90_2798 [Thioalkalivibrio sp. K90mix]
MLKMTVPKGIAVILSREAGMAYRSGLKVALEYFETAMGSRGFRLIAANPAWLEKQPPETQSRFQGEKLRPTKKSTVIR